MAYYHILKERRTNLKLSIQDVSNQTRLAPQYIQAIEEHNLDVFSDDLSFVGRPFQMKLMWMSMNLRIKETWL